MTNDLMRLEMFEERLDKINKQNLELAVESEVLDCVPIKLTIKQYFKALLAMLFDDSEFLAGRMQFLNSDWKREIRECLIKNKIVEIAINEHGEEDCTDEEFYMHISELIISL